jgi:hypothetical protein
MLWGRRAEDVAQVFAVQAQLVGKLIVGDHRDMRNALP